MKLLQSDHWRLWLEPDRGVQWMAAQVRQGDRWISVVADCRPPAPQVDDNNTSAVPNHTEVPWPRDGQDEAAPLIAANFHMIPYSNRIRDGRFSFDGTEYKLSDSDNHSLHGALRKLPWRIVKETEHELVCEYSSSKDGRINWPWAITAEIYYTVKEDKISSVIRVRNDGGSLMPVGFGWHPYFVRTIDGVSPELCIPVSGVYPDTDGDCLPTGSSEALPTKLDFRKPRALETKQRIDHCFSGLDGPVTITWPTSGIKLKMQASRNCGHLVLFNPAKPHFAVEPVTNANDAFNLAKKGIDSGVISLAPGDWTSGDFALFTQ